MVVFEFGFDLSAIGYLVSALLAVEALFGYFDFYANGSCSTIGYFDFCTIGS